MVSPLSNACPVLSVKALRKARLPPGFCISGPPRCVAATFGTLGEAGHQIKRRQPFLISPKRKAAIEDIDEAA